MAQGDTAPLSAGDAPFRHEQRRVAASMAAAVAVTLATPLLLLWLRPFSMPDLVTPSARLAYAVGLESPVLACLAAAVANVARLRFFSPRDIGGSATAEAGPAVRRAGAVLQNTLEQSILALGAHCALAVQLPARGMVVLPGLVGLFCLGRALFWLGYRHGAAGRAFGFGLTFYPSLGACLAALVLMVR